MSKILLPLSVALVALLGLVVFALSREKNQTLNESSTPLQASAYCTGEFLEGVRNSTPSSEEEVKKYFDCKPILAYLKNNVSDSKAETLVDSFKQLDGVYKVKYVSKAEALKIYQERNKNEPLLTEHITEDFLPASIEVYVSEPSLKVKAVEFAESNVLVDKVVK